MLQLREVADSTFVLLPADWTVAQARRYLEGLDYTHVIVRRTDDPRPGSPTYHYLYTKKKANARLDPLKDSQTIREAFDLHEPLGTPSLEGDTDADQAPDRTVVLDRGEVAGYFDATEMPVHELRGVRSVPRTLEATPSLEAYPALEAPERVAGGAEFEIEVGLRPDPDPRAVHSGTMVFRDVQAGEQCLVVLVTEGIEVSPGHGLLPLRPDARISFRCRAQAADGTATVKAQFFFRNQLVGVAQRHIAVGAGPGPTAAGPRDAPARLSLPGPASQVDLTVTVTYGSDGTLQWTWRAPATGEGTTDPVPTRLAGAREFANDLLRDLRTQSFAGEFAANVLSSKGQEITSLMPTAFFKTLERVHAAVGRPPTLLLITNESYVPWELAWLATPLDPNLPPYLAAQTCMGRWLEDESVDLPPAVTVDVRRATAVAALYDLQTGQPQLPESVAERKALEKLKFIPLEARIDDLRAVVTGAVAAGHLIHFAVHGLSAPNENSQALLLADGQQLPASALTGAYRRGDVPRFVFVFLNACQVGTAGTSFGQAAGFPGTLVRRGVLGFVAPLWDVDDALARAFAERFYKDTLTGAETVGAVLRAGRAAYRTDQSTTPLAYIYYGHPALRLKNSLT
jgi:hypothetical protein